MSVKCLLCGEEYSVISGRHLKSAHKITTLEYLVMFPGAELCDDEFRQKVSDGVNRPEVKKRISEGVSKTMLSYYAVHERSEETCRRLSESLMGHEVSVETRQLLSERLTGLRHSEETKRLMSESHRGYRFSEESRQRIARSNKVTWSNPELRRQLSEKFMGHKVSEKASRQIAESLKNYYATHEVEVSEETRRRLSESLIGHEVSEETRRRLSETHKEKWKDPEYAKRMFQAQNRKPNERELQLQSILDRHFPGEWKYTGNGSFWVGGKNPDFTNANGKKQLIEVFGYYWHGSSNRPTEEELIAHYKKFGFDCLVFWEFDVYNEKEVIERIRKWG